MKKSNKNILYLTTIILIITIAILIGIVINSLKANEILSNNEINKEQLGETISDNAYIDAQLHFKELKDEQEKLLLFKSSIATAITNEGIATSSSDTSLTMASNISNILKTKTTLNSDVAATPDNISEGKQAWVNGELITGTNQNANKNYYPFSINISGGIYKQTISGSTTVNTGNINTSEYTIYGGVVSAATSYENGSLGYHTLRCSLSMSCSNGVTTVTATFNTGYDKYPAASATIHGVIVPR